MSSQARDQRLQSLNLLFLFPVSRIPGCNSPIRFVPFERANLIDPVPCRSAFRFFEPEALSIFAALRFLHGFCTF